MLDADEQQQSLAFTIPNVQVLAALGRDALPDAIAASSAAWTLIDCPPSLLEAAPAIPLADLVLAPVPPRFQDLSGFARLRETVDAAHERGNPHLQVLVTVRDARVTLQAERAASKAPASCRHF